MSNDDDRELVQRALGGDRDAFGTLVVRYQGPVYNAAFWVLHRPDDARDIAQDVFLKAWERLEDYDPQYRFFSWIYRIAVNESLNHLRRLGREEPLDDGFDPPGEPGDDPAARLDGQQQSQQLRAAMARLGSNDRAVVSLRHFAELSYEEIAETLDIDTKTVKSRLFEARQRLRHLLEGKAKR